MMIKSLNALGIFAGASLNFIELALLNTDGIDIKQITATERIPYPEKLANDIRTLTNKRCCRLDELQKDEIVQSVRKSASYFYADTIKDFIKDKKVDCIGIDGLTIISEPLNHCSYQIEDGHLLSNLLSQQIITHFHKADLLAGGQASPLSPAFLNAFAAQFEKPLLFIDIESPVKICRLSTSQIWDANSSLHHDHIPQDIAKRRCGGFLVFRVFCCKIPYIIRIIRIIAYIVSLKYMHSSLFHIL